MTPEASPYDPAIAQVEAEIERLRVTLETLKRLRAQPDGVGMLPGASRAISETDIAHDTFFQMTIADAARKYLGIVKTTKSTSEIAEALERGGLKHSSKDFSTTVRSILGQREWFVRVNSDWGLSEWYPAMRKEKKVKTEKQQHPETQTPTAPKTKKQKAAAPLSQRIVDLMKTEPDKDWLSRELSNRLDAPLASVMSTASRMANSGEQIRRGDRGYRLANLQPVATGIVKTA